ncbi:MAG: hypothetical protein ACL7AX_13660 [Candidatus Arsenophonus phytopathogenicus]
MGKGTSIRVLPKSISLHRKRQDESDEGSEIEIAGDVPPIEEEEIETALREMKDHKAQGEDNTVAWVIQTTEAAQKDSR